MGGRYRQARGTRCPTRKAERIESFEGGHVTFAFGRSESADGWEVRTMFVEPLKPDPQPDQDVQ